MHTHRSSLAVHASVALTLVLPWTAQAQTSSDTLGLPEAIASALRESPDVRAARLRAEVRRELRLERREPDDVREDGRRVGEVQVDAGEADRQIRRVQLFAEHRPAQLEDERLGRARAHAGNRLRGEKHDPDDCV